MATPLLAVINDFCEVYTDDFRLKELKETDAPLYARRMWGYLKPALARCNKPQALREFIAGTKTEPKIKEPKYDSYYYTVETTQTSPFTVDFGEEFKNYEICAARLRLVDDFNNVLLLPIAITYVPEQGTATVEASTQNPILAESEIDFDFYTDGEFENDLSFEIQNIIGMAFNIVWQARFNESFLDLTPKIEDRSFSEQNRANKERADTERIKQLERSFAGEIRQFEQNLAYNQTVSKSRRLIID